MLNRLPKGKVSGGEKQQINPNISFKVLKIYGKINNKLTQNNIFLPTQTHKDGKICFFRFQGINFKVGLTQYLNLILP